MLGVALRPGSLGRRTPPPVDCPRRPQAPSMGPGQPLLARRGCEVTYNLRCPTRCVLRGSHRYLCRDPRAAHGQVLTTSHDPRGAQVGQMRLQSPGLAALDGIPSLQGGPHCRYKTASFPSFTSPAVGHDIPTTTCTSARHRGASGRDLSILRQPIAVISALLELRPTSSPPKTRPSRLQRFGNLALSRHFETSSRSCLAKLTQYVPGISSET